MYLSIQCAQKTQHNTKIVSINLGQVVVKCERPTKT